ncbi:hypothetical protein GW215_19370 [Escherichia coli]|nr:hypothetical protein [Escherichia coli]
MNFSAALHGTLKEMKKSNTVGISVQTCSDIFDSNVPPAYVFWLYRLKAGEMLPRGKFFRKGKPIIKVMAVVQDTASEK